MASIPHGLIHRSRVFFSRILARIYYLLPELLRRPILRLVARLIPWGSATAQIVETNLVIAYPGGAPAKRDLRARLEGEARVRRLRLWLERSGGWRDDHCHIKGIGNWELLGERQGNALLVVSLLGSPDLVRRRLRRAGIGARNAVFFETAANGRSVRIPWFGVPVRMTTAPMEYVRETHAAIIPVVSYRNPEQGEFVVEILPELPWVSMPGEPDLEIAVNTARLAGHLEERQRAYPADWPWWRPRFKGNLDPLRDGEWSESRFPS